MMMRIWHVVLYALFSLLFVSSAHAQEAKNSMVLSGVVLEGGHHELTDKFISWLSRKADYPLSVRFTSSYQGLSESLREHSKDLAWTCGVPFVEDHASDGQQLIAVPLFKSAPEYYSLVVTRAGRPEKTLQDFEGKVFAYSDPRSNSGFIAPAFHLKKSGVNIKSHFRYLMHTGLHEYSIEAVLAGQADVANIDEYVVVQYFKSHPDAEKKLVVLERFGPFPFTPIVAGKGVSKEEIERLQRALLMMHEDAEGAEILQQFGLDGFVVQPVSFYQPIADMLDSKL